MEAPHRHQPLCVDSSERSFLLFVVCGGSRLRAVCTERTLSELMERRQANERRRVERIIQVSLSFQHTHAG